MTPEQYLAWFDAVEAKARLGAGPTAEAMAKHVADRIQNDTLRRRRTSPGQYYRAKRGEPPSYGTGKLADSIYSTPASGGLRARAWTGSSDQRAKLFELGGCVLKPGDGKLLHWKDSGGWWSHPFLRVDTEHPFLRPTVEDAVDDGSLREAAIDAFRPYDP